MHGTDKLRDGAQGRGPRLGEGLLNISDKLRSRACAGLKGAGFAALMLAGGAAMAQDRPIALTDARILTMAGDTIEDGTLLFEDGRIVAVGADVAIPADAERRSMEGRVIMPGIVDTHSHIGQVAGADSAGPIQPDVRAMDSINPLSPNIAKARAGGVTTANVMPGSGHLVSGQTFYLKLREGTTIEDVAFEWKDGAAIGGLKMANGTNSLRRGAASPARGPSRPRSCARPSSMRRPIVRASARSATLPRKRCAKSCRVNGWSISTPTARTTS